MVQILSEDKQKIIIEYPFVRQFILHPSNKKIFLSNLERFEQELLSRGLTKADLDWISAYSLIKEQLVKRYKGFETDVYHATYAGEKTCIFKSFIKEGAKSGLAQGYGQGTGFYAWTRRELAVNHAINFLEDKPGSYKMIVKMRAKIRPADWDIDYEVDAKCAVRFIIDNFVIFKNIPDGLIDVGGDKLMPSKCVIRGDSIAFSLKIAGGGTRKFGLSRDTEEVSTVHGELLGKCLNYLQEHFPQNLAEAEIKWFSEERNIPAVKYVGKKPLRVDAVEVFVRGGWVLVYSEKKITQEGIALGFEQ